MIFFNNIVSYLKNFHNNLKSLIPGKYLYQKVNPFNTVMYFLCLISKSIVGIDS